MAASGGCGGKHYCGGIMRPVYPAPTKGYSTFKCDKCGHTFNRRNRVAKMVTLRMEREKVREIIALLPEGPLRTMLESFV